MLKGNRFEQRARNASEVIFSYRFNARFISKKQESAQSEPELPIEGNRWDFELPKSKINGITPNLRAMNRSVSTAFALFNENIQRFCSLFSLSLNRSRRVVDVLYTTKVAALRKFPANLFRICARKPYNVDILRC